MPVALYGLCLFECSVDELQPLLTAEKRAWRQLLGLGGRSPVNCLNFCWGMTSCALETRVQRAGLFIRLLNSPTTSWEHTALLVQRFLNTVWYRAVLMDLNLVYPGVH
eukprot:2768256-Karenia_brevis.AAC.1